MASDTNLNSPQVVLKELEQALSHINEKEAETLLKSIEDCGKVFLAGAGRSGLMAKAFCMRLMHMGIHAHVLGETTTSTFEKEDLLILCTGSGETGTLVHYAKKAKNIGGKIAAITIKPESTVGSLADFVVKMPGAVKERKEGEESTVTVQPMGSLFEQSLLLFFDSLILQYMSKHNLKGDVMYGMHANLE
ncbi:MAG: 6-phospho-3-hexuloisomerase [Defluviitaleaceae bacterium]|nr:6-phospho-3-hexuloisomerase [Defluviitaleaceae bacterium]